MAAFKTRAIPVGKPLKLSQPKPPAMPKLALPTMRTGAGPKLPQVSLPRAAAGGQPPPIRRSPMSGRIAYAASTSSPGALGTPPAGYRRQRNQAL